jgi:hypothetical protein
VSLAACVAVTIVSIVWYTAAKRQIANRKTLHIGLLRPVIAARSLLIDEALTVRPLIAPDDVRNYVGVFVARRASLENAVEETRQGVGLGLVLPSFRQDLVETIVSAIDTESARAHAARNALTAIALVESHSRRTALQALNSAHRSLIAIEKDSDEGDFRKNLTDLRHSLESVEGTQAEVRSLKAMPLPGASEEALRKSMLAQIDSSLVQRRNDMTSWRNALTHATHQLVLAKHSTATALRKAALVENVDAVFAAVYRPLMVASKIAENIRSVLVTLHKPLAPQLARILAPETPNISSIDVLAKFDKRAVIITEEVRIGSEAVIMTAEAMKPTADVIIPLGKSIRQFRRERSLRSMRALVACARGARPFAVTQLSRIRGTLKQSKAMRNAVSDLDRLLVRALPDSVAPLLRTLSRDSKSMIRTAESPLRRLEKQLALTIDMFDAITQSDDGYRNQMQLLIKKTATPPVSP